MSVRDELMAARRAFAQQVANALTDVPPADTRAIETARRVLGNEIGDTGDLLAIQPELEAAAETLAELSTRSEETTRRCLRLTPVPSPRLPRGF